MNAPNITCERIEALLVPYLDGNLAAAERQAVEAHLKGCAGCESRRAGFLAVADHLDAWLAPEPSPWFDAKLRQRIAAQAEARHAPRWVSVLAPSFPASVMALVLLAALLVWGGGRPSFTPEMVANQNMDEVMHALDEVDLLYQADFLGEMSTVR